MRDIQLRSIEARSDAAVMSDAALCLAYAGLPFVSKHPNIQASYIRMRISGETHNLAEMLALRKFPGVQGTDSDFMRGTHAQDDAIDQVRFQAAASQGVDTNGKRYLSSLARYPNDPEAWVSGRSDVLRICRERGWNCHGLVEHESPKLEPTADILIAPDIVQQHANACVAAFDQGEVGPQLIGDITEQVTKELSGEIDLNEELKVSDYDDPFALDGMQPD